MLEVIRKLYLIQTPSSISCEIRLLPTVPDTLVMSKGPSFHYSLTQWLHWEPQEEIVSTQFQSRKPKMHIKISTRQEKTRLVLCHLDIIGNMWKKEQKLRKCLHQNGLWASLWNFFLISSLCGMGQPIVGGAWTDGPVCFRKAN